MIILKTVKKEQGGDGFLREKELLSLLVMAELKSVKRSEYYQAQREGIEIQMMAVVNTCDYEAAIVKDGDKRILPGIVEHDEVIYKIVRTYKKGRKIEITLQEVE